MLNKIIKELQKFYNSVISNSGHGEFNIKIQNHGKDVFLEKTEKEQLKEKEN